MKIALCLSGMPRTVEQGYASLKEILLDKYDVDVFIHTWQEEGYKPTSWAEKPIYAPPTGSSELRYSNIIKVLTLYKPISFQIDKYHVYREYYRRADKFKLLHRYCSMLESIYIANKLKTVYELNNNFTYDCVIRCRFDIGFQHFIPFEEFDLANNIYVQNVLWWNIKRQINDWFAFGSSKNIDIWCDLYKHMEEIRDAITDNEFIEVYNRLNEGPDPHVLYATYVKIKNLSIIGLPINWNRLEEEKRVYD
jgi:hypothetical protein